MLLCSSDFIGGVREAVVWVWLDQDQRAECPDWSPESSLVIALLLNTSSAQGHLPGVAVVSAGKCSCLPDTGVPHCHLHLPSGV